MSDRAQRDDSDVADAEAAFLTLSHELRLEILLALWAAEGFSLSFSELREAAGAPDSGSFNYHLGELRDHFVAKTDDGYELQYPGHRVLDAIQSGVFHEEATVGPVGVDGDCRQCGGGLAFAYDEASIARVTCRDCGNRALEWPFDPGGTADRDPGEVAAAFDRRTRRTWACALDGVCPFCAGRVDRDLTERVREDGVCVGVIDELDRYEEYFAGDHDAHVAVDCKRCSFYSFVPVGVVLLTRPRVLADLHDAGVDVRETPLWDLGFVVGADAASVVSSRPTRVEVDVVDVDADLAFVVDDALGVEPAGD